MVISPYPPPKRVGPENSVVIEATSAAIQSMSAREVRLFVQTPGGETEYVVAIPRESVETMLAALIAWKTDRERLGD